LAKFGLGVEKNLELYSQAKSSAAVSVCSTILRKGPPQERADSACRVTWKNLVLA